MPRPRNRRYVRIDQQLTEAKDQFIQQRAVVIAGDLNVILAEIKFYLRRVSYLFG